MRIKRFLLTLIVFGSGLGAEELPKPADKDLADAKARIAWLEQKLGATEAKAQACLQIYGADMQLNNLATREPKVTPPEPKAPEPKK
jgi:hypothetical protein